VAQTRRYSAGRRLLQLVHGVRSEVAVHRYSYGEIGADDLTSGSGDTILNSVAFPSVRVFAVEGSCPDLVRASQETPLVRAVDRCARGHAGVSHPLLVSPGRGKRAGSGPVRAGDVKDMQRKCGSAHDPADASSASNCRFFLFLPATCARNNLPSTAT
jgi:hypothetical protein